MGNPPGLEPPGLLALNAIVVFGIPGFVALLSFLNLSLECFCFAVMGDGKMPNGIVAVPLVSWFLTKAFHRSDVAHASEHCCAVPCISDLEFAFAIVRIMSS